MNFRARNDVQHLRALKFGLILEPWFGETLVDSFIEMNESAKVPLPYPGETNVSHGIRTYITIITRRADI
jgi:hypothetical protein